MHKRASAWLSGVVLSLTQRTLSVAVLTNSGTEGLLKNSVDTIGCHSERSEESAFSTLSEQADPSSTPKAWRTQHDSINPGIWGNS